MKNTKRIKAGTILTVVWFNGDVKKYIYGPVTKDFLNEQTGISAFGYTYDTIQDIIDKTKYWIGMTVKYYGIQEPVFKY